MIDTHMHLDLLGDAGALDRAAAAGVTDIVGIGVDPRVPSVPKSAPPPGLRIHHALGLHPQALVDQGALDEALAVLERRLDGERVVALGETGLDARPGMPDLALQLRAFERQLAIARERKLPVVLHGVRRDAAMLDAIDRELKRGPMKLLWHGFSSSKEVAREAIARGVVISVGFVSLNEKARRLREAVPHIPAAQLVVETDAPPLSPERIVDVVAAVARLRGETVEDVVRTTRANATRFFALRPDAR